MAHGFILEKSIRAKDVDSLNKNVISIAVSDGTVIGDNIDGGYVFQLTKTKLSDLPANVGLTGSENGEIYRVSKPLTESSGDLDETTILAHANGLAMAYNPEIKNLSFDGKEYAGLSSDIRDFTNVAKKPFSAFMLKKGDLIEISADSLSGTYVASGDNATNYLIPDDSSYKLTFSKTPNIVIEGDGDTTPDTEVACTCLEIIEVRSELFPQANVGNEYVTTYLCEVKAE
jgi:hypothetical protein